MSDVARALVRAGLDSREAAAWVDAYRHAHPSARAALDRWAAGEPAEEPAAGAHRLADLLAVLPPTQAFDLLDLLLRDPLTGDVAARHALRAAGRRGDSDA